MYNATTLIGLCFLLLPGCVATNSSPSPSPSQDSPAKVKVLLNPHPDEVCIAVQVASAVPGSGDKKGEIQITIINRLDEEVFVNVTGFDSLSYSFSYQSTDDNGFAATSGGGAFIAFPDNTHMLKRLHATVTANGAKGDAEHGGIGFVEDTGKTGGTAGGKRFTCACAKAHITGKIGDEKTDLKSWVGRAERHGATMTVRIPIAGYLRNSGRAFSEMVEVPVTISGG